MSFLLRALFWTCISRLFGRFLWKEKNKIEVELGVFVITFIFTSAWLLIFDWLL